MQVWAGSGDVAAWLVAGGSVLAALAVLVLARATVRTRGLAVRTGIPALIGQPGLAVSELAPSGVVRVDSEVWSAESDGGAPIEPGEPVTVVGAFGVTLRVTRADGGSVRHRPYRGGPPWLNTPRSLS